MNTTNQMIMDAFQFRHACKHFDPTRAVSKEDFDTILEAAHYSPSSFGLEPWRFLVVQDPELKKKLYPIAWGARNSLDGASHLVILMARKKVDTIYNSEYVRYIIQDLNQYPPDVAAGRLAGLENFQKNDFSILESDRAMFDWACRQTYIALADMLFAAALLRVDACPIEGFQRREVDALLTAEGLMDPEHFGVSVMAGFGYRAAQPRPKVRQPLENVVFWK